MVLPSGDLVEVSLEMPSTQVMVDAVQSVLQLEGDSFGRVHGSAGLRVGNLLLAMDHILVGGHSLDQAPRMKT